MVGAGGISNTWFKALGEEQVPVAAVVDLDFERAKQKIAEHGLAAEASTDLKATLKKHRPDFVLDLTVPDAHYGVVCTALRMGCHVLGEKPMAATMAQARRMVKTADDTGRMYMIDQSRRWDAQHDVFRRMVNGGEIGRPTTLNCDFYVGAHFGGFRDDMPSPLILDMAIHHFDLGRYFSGTDPVSVYAHEFNPSGSWYKGAAAASCIFEMTGGIVFTYRGSWCSEGCHTTWNGNWRIAGERGTLLMENGQAPRGQTVAGNKGFHRPLKDLITPPAELKHAAMRGALREMLAFLRTGQRPQTACQDNIKSLAMVLAAIESSHKGRRVSVRF